MPPAAARPLPVPPSPAHPPAAPRRPPPPRRPRSLLTSRCRRRTDPLGRYFWERRPGRAGTTFPRRSPLTGRSAQRAPRGILPRAPPARPDAGRSAGGGAAGETEGRLRGVRGPQRGRRRPGGWGRHGRITLCRRGGAAGPASLAATPVARGRPPIGQRGRAEGGGGASETWGVGVTGGAANGKGGEGTGGQSAAERGAEGGGRAPCSTASADEAPPSRLGQRMTHVGSPAPERRRMRGAAAPVRAQARRRRAQGLPGNGCGSAPRPAPPRPRPCQGPAATGTPPPRSPPLSPPQRAAGRKGVSRRERQLRNKTCENFSPSQNAGE